MTTCTTENTDHDKTSDWEDFRGLITRFFQSVVKADTPLFLVESTEELWGLFLRVLPAAERQHHLCHNCRHFIQRFGGLVTITERGEVKSVVWPTDSIIEKAGLSPVYTRVAKRIRDAVQHGTIKGVFKSEERHLGLAITGAWTHIAVPNPQQYTKITPTAEQAAATVNAEFGMLERVVKEYPLALCQQAQALLTSGRLYRPETHLPTIDRLIAFHQRRERFTNAKARRNLLWREVAIGATVLAHARGTVIGQLMDNLTEGKSAQEVMGAWNAAMDPGSYQRSTAAPAEGTVRRAEQLFADLKLAPALPRRYAKITELLSCGVLWSSAAARVLKSRATKQKIQPGVFGHLDTKTGAPAAPSGPLSAGTLVTMTWAKFDKVVLPSAQALHALVPDNANHFAALVTAVDPKAPCLLKWDREDRRNPFSWYYHGGVDASMRARVLAAGGKVDDVDIRATLAWDNRNDLDLHVLAPVKDRPSQKHHIYFAEKKPYGQNGWLDVDMNVRGETDKPVENTRWARGEAIPGVYEVYVENYRFHEKHVGATPFRAELVVFGHVFHCNGICLSGRNHADSRVVVAKFKVIQDASGRLVFGGFLGGEMSLLASYSQVVTDTSWAPTSGTWAEVLSIAKSPNLWTRECPENGNHTFFLLKDAEDKSKGLGRGFFPEMLRPDLREVRSVLEAYAASAEIASTDDAIAAGLGYSSDQPWGLRLRVTTAAGTTDYLIDRAD